MTTFQHTDLTSPLLARYLGEESLYADMLTHWHTTGGSLNLWSLGEYDECRSVAHMHMHTPVYANDPVLLAFVDALDAAILVALDA